MCYAVLCVINNSKQLEIKIEFSITLHFAIKLEIEGRSTIENDKEHAGEASTFAKNSTGEVMCLFLSEYFLIAQSVAK